MNNINHPAKVPGIMTMSSINTVTDMMSIGAIVPISFQVMIRGLSSFTGLEIRRDVILSLPYHGIRKLIFDLSDLTSRADT